MWFVLQEKIIYYLISIGHVFFKSAKSRISYRMNHRRQHLNFKWYAKESGLWTLVVYLPKMWLKIKQFSYINSYQSKNHFCQFHLNMINCITIKIYKGNLYISKININKQYLALHIRTCTSEIDQIANINAHNGNCL